MEALTRHLAVVDRDPGDENDEDLRAKLAPPPRPLQKGERWDGRNILYSAAWIDEDGNLHEFQA